MDETAPTTDGTARTIREPVWPHIARQSPTQRFYLQRLRHMVEIAARVTTGDQSLSAFERDLVRRSIYHTYCDCRDHRVEAEARAILRQLDGERVIPSD